MEDWNDYLLILALHRAGTLRGAAVMLSTTHTTVARRLELMHKRRNACVFEKISGGYRATSLGEHLIEVAKRIEQVTIVSDRYQRSVGESLAGPLTLSLSEPIAQFLLIEDLMRFVATYPDIELRIECSEQLANLDRSEADVVVRGTNQPSEHLVGRKLFPYYLSYYANREYFNNTDNKLFRWIAPGNSGTWPEWLAASPFPDAPIAVSINEVISRHKALVAGYGLGRGACFMADQEPELMRLPGSPLTPAVDLWLLTHPDLRHTPRVKVLMQFLLEVFESKRDLITGQRPQK